MVRRLPSLTGLRAFEAAARHESFKEGARELGVTQAAVSHQIKALEIELGRKLFQRGTRQVKLTREAAILARVLSDSFGKITEATEALRGDTLAGRLRISVTPFYGNRWLMPRLLKFRAKFPQIDVQVDFSFDLVDLTGSDFEAAVRYGDGNWPDLECMLIHRDEVGPVCAPQYVAGRQLPLAPDEIARLALATSADISHDWADWLAAAGASSSDEIDLVEYSNSAYSFDAALSGNAVCLVDTRLSAADEAAGNLVRLHPLTVERAKGFFLVFAKGQGPRPRERTFAEWMRQEAGVESGHRVVSTG